MNRSDEMRETYTATPDIFDALASTGKTYGYTDLATVPTRTLKAGHSSFRKYHGLLKSLIDFDGRLDGSSEILEESASDFNALLRNARAGDLERAVNSVSDDNVEAFFRWVLNGGIDPRIGKGFEYGVPVIEDNDFIPSRSVETASIQQDSMRSLVGFFGSRGKLTGFRSSDDDVDVYLGFDSTATMVRTSSKGGGQVYDVPFMFKGEYEEGKPVIVAEKNEAVAGNLRFFSEGREDFDPKKDIVKIITDGNPFNVRTVYSERIDLIRKQGCSGDEARKDIAKELIARVVERRFADESTIKDLPIKEMVSVLSRVAGKVDDVKISAGDMKRNLRDVLAEGRDGKSFDFEAGRDLQASRLSEYTEACARTQLFYLNEHMRKLSTNTRFLRWFSERYGEGTSVWSVPINEFTEFSQRFVPDFRAGASLTGEKNTLKKVKRTFSLIDPETGVYDKRMVIRLEPGAKSKALKDIPKAVPNKTIPVYVISDTNDTGFFWTGCLIDEMMRINKTRESAGMRPAYDVRIRGTTEPYKDKNGNPLIPWHRYDEWLSAGSDGSRPVTERKGITPSVGARNFFFRMTGDHMIGRLFGEVARDLSNVIRRADPSVSKFLDERGYRGYGRESLKMLFSVSRYRRPNKKVIISLGGGRRKVVRLTTLDADPERTGKPETKLIGRKKPKPGEVSLPNLSMVMNAAYEHIGGISRQDVEDALKSLVKSGVISYYRTDGRGFPKEEFERLKREGLLGESASAALYSPETGIYPKKPSRFWGDPGTNERRMMNLIVSLMGEAKTESIYRITQRTNERVTDSRRITVFHEPDVEPSFLYDISYDLNDPIPAGEIEGGTEATRGELIKKMQQLGFLDTAFRLKENAFIGINHILPLLYRVSDVDRYETPADVYDYIESRVKTLERDQRREMVETASRRMANTVFEDEKKVIDPSSEKLLSELVRRGYITFRTLQKKGPSSRRLVDIGRDLEKYVAAKPKERRWMRKVQDGKVVSGLFHYATPTVTGERRVVLYDEDKILKNGPPFVLFQSGTGAVNDFTLLPYKKRRMSRVRVPTFSYTESLGRLNPKSRKGQDMAWLDFLYSVGWITDEEYKNNEITVDRKDPSYKERLSVLKRFVSKRTPQDLKPFVIGMTETNGVDVIDSPDVPESGG